MPYNNACRHNIYTDPMLILFSICYKQNTNRKLMFAPEKQIDESIYVFKKKRYTRLRLEIAIKILYHIFLSNDINEIVTI